MASSRRKGTNENIQTYDSAGGKDFSDVSTWESATDTDLVTSETSEVLEVFKGSHLEDWAVAGATANVLYHRIIRPAAGEGHSGVPKSDGSMAEMHNTNGALDAAFDSNEAFFSIQDMVLRSNINSASTRHILRQQADNNFGIGILIFDSANAGAGTIRCFRTDGDGSVLVNCLANDPNFGVITGFLFQDADKTRSAYNCTATDCFVGFQHNDGTTILKNCLASNGTDYSAGFTKTTCSAESDQPVFRADDPINMRIDGTDTIGRGTATDLSADATFAFDDDYNDRGMGAGKSGKKRVGSWDMGIYQFYSRSHVT